MQNDVYVLPHPKSLEPVDIKTPIEQFRDDIKIPELKFQNLRKTFISYAVSYGIPPAIVAFWVALSNFSFATRFNASDNFQCSCKGQNLKTSRACHIPAVAEKHFADFVARYNSRGIAYVQHRGLGLAAKPLKYAIGQLKGDNIEETMGLKGILKEILQGYAGKGKYKNLKLTKWNIAEDAEQGGFWKVKLQNIYAIVAVFSDKKVSHRINKGYLYTINIIFWSSDYFQIVSTNFE